MKHNRDQRKPILLNAFFTKDKTKHPLGFSTETRGYSTPKLSSLIWLNIPKKQQLNIDINSYAILFHVFDRIR